MTIKQDLQLEQLLNVKCLQNFFVGNKLQSAFMSVVSISYSMFFTNTFAFVFIVNISYLSYILGVLTLYSRLKLIKVSRLGGRNLHSRPL
jgi:hypothetical protein